MNVPTEYLPRIRVKIVNTPSSFLLRGNNHCARVPLRRERDFIELVTLHHRLDILEKATQQDLCKSVIATNNVNCATTSDCVLKVDALEKDTEQDLCKTVVVASKVKWATTLDCDLKLDALERAWYPTVGRAHTRHEKQNCEKQNCERTEEKPAGNPGWKRRPSGGEAGGLRIGYRGTRSYETAFL